MVDFIDVFDSVLPSTFCDELIHAFEQHPAVREGVTGSGFDPKKKLSSDLTLDSHDDLRPALARLQPYTLAHLAIYFRRYPLALIGALSPTILDQTTRESKLLDLATFESLGEPQLFTLIKTLFRSGVVNLQRYRANVGGYPHWHSEIFPQGDRAEPLHRVLFYMYYLNEVEAGGETEFFFQRRKVVPKKGTMLIAPAGFTHSHRGNVPTSGDKYILTSWLMFRRAEELYASRSSRT